MKQEDLLHFRSLLHYQLNELLHKADNTLADLIDTSEHPTEMIDLAHMEMNRGFTLRIREREMRLIEKIIIALENIENGSFGICEACGEEIALQRLEARPVTTYCIACKKEMEALEQSRGPQRASGFGMPRFRRADYSALRAQSEEN